MSDNKYPLQKNQYTIKQIDSNTFIKNNIDDNTDFTNDMDGTIAIIKTAEYKHIDSNSHHNIISKYLQPFLDDINYIQAEIIWFDSIIIDINDINKLQKINIVIGGGLIWQMDIKYLLQIYKPTIFDNKIKITFPKNLFFDNNNNYITSIKLNEFIGIPLICLSYHELNFVIESLTNIKYDLILTAVNILCPKIKAEFTGKGHDMNIINHTFIPNHDIKIKSIYPYKFPFTNNNIISSDNIINCMNKLININIKKIIIDLPILINDLKNIVIEYLQMDYYFLNFIVENDLQYNYLIWFNTLRFMSGMAGIMYSLNNYDDDDYVNSPTIYI
jgi:hypothetical protein